MTLPRLAPSLAAVLAALLVASTVTVGLGRVVGSDAAATFTVNSTGTGNDVNPGNGVCSTAAVGGVCTLRAAIQESNALAGTDTIRFAIPVADPGYNGTWWTITVAGKLPALDQSVVIDGRTQTGWAAGGAPKVMIDHAGAGGPAFDVKAAAIEVRGLAIGNVNGIAVKVNPVDGFVLTDSYLGLLPNGTTTAPNNDRGIEMTGGSTNAVLGTPGAGNVITASAKEEVHLRGSGHTVRGNVVGMNAAGTVASGGAAQGLRVHDAANLTIGGTGPGEGNLVAGNGGGGTSDITIDDGSPTIQGNIIGFRRDGVTPVGTALHAIYYKQGLTSAPVTIGGTASGAGNVIGGSTGAGIFIENDKQHVTVLGNTIRNSGGLGIDLQGGTEDAFGVTANDAGDTDNGANGRMNFPVLWEIGKTAARFSADLKPASYRIELFRNPGGVDPSGYGEGETFVGAGHFAHAGGGERFFTVTGLSGIVNGDAITATITACVTPACAAYGATSEFSAARTAIVRPAVTGTVYEDVDGDGDVADDGVGLRDVAVRLYLDDGDGVPDGGDPQIGATTTLASGAWFLETSALGPMWVAFGPASASPATGLAGAAGRGDVTPDQTWAAAGAATYDGGWSISGAAGPVLGGARLGVSDGFPDLGAAEHIMRAVGAGSDITGLDVGFSFNAVTTTRDEAATDGFTDAARWDAFDLSTSGLGVDPRGFENGASDGRYLYFAPDTNGSGEHGQVVRLDTTGDFNAAASWAVFNAATAGLGGDPRGYADAAFDGRYVYFSPETKGGARHSTVLRYDTTAPFNLASSWRTFDPDPGLAGTPRGFQGVVYDGRYLHFAPSAGGTEALRYDTLMGFTDITAWSSFNLATGGVPGDHLGFDAPGEYDGRYVYWTSASTSSGEVLRLDTWDVWASASAWTTYDPTDDGIGSDGARGLVLGNGALYLVPNSNGATHGDILRHDLAGDFTRAADWAVFDPAVDSGTSAWDGAVFDGRYITFAPSFRGGGWSSEVLRYDTTAPFATDASWSMFDPLAAGVGTSPEGYDGALFDGRYVYLVPDGSGTSLTHGEVLRYDVAPAGQGTLRTALSNAAATTGQQSLDFQLSTADAGYDGSAWHVPLGTTLAVSSSVVLDGSSQAGWTGDPVVALVGNAVAGDAVTVSGSNVVIAGLSVTGAGGDGISVGGDSVTLTDMWLGQRPDGSAAGNGGSGLRFHGTVTAGLVTESVIRANVSSGVVVADTATAAVVANSIVGNTGLGIDLGDDGVTANDPGDADPGPNLLLNSPVLSDVSTDDVGAVEVTIDLDVPAGAHRVELYSNPSGLDGLAGEGEVLIKSFDVTSAGAAFSVTTAVGAGVVGDDITATVTRLVAATPTATSEFSPGVTVSADLDLATSPVLPDASAAREDGRPSGGLGAADVVAGRVGQALDLDGGDDRVALWGPAQAGNTLTVSAWAQPAGDGSIVSRSDGATTVWEIARVGGLLTGTVTLDGGAPVALTGPALPAGTWVHVALVLDGATARLYLDGVLVDTNATAGTLVRDPAVRTWIGGAGADGTTMPFLGVIDEVRVRPVVLTANRLRTEATVEAAPGSAVTLGASQLRTAGGWSVDATTGRTGSRALDAPRQRSAAWLTIDSIAETGLEVSSWWLTSGAPTDVAAGVRATPGSNGPVQDEATLRATGWGLSRWDITGAQVVAPPGGQTPYDAWEQVVVRTDQDGDLSAIADGVAVGPFAGPGVRGSGTGAFRTGFLSAAQRWWIDDVRVRRFVDPEPTTRVGPSQPAP